MQENKSTLSFREQYTERQEIKTANENSWFCIVTGTLLFLIGGYGYLCSTSVLSVLSSVAAVTGLITAFAGGFFPKITAIPISFLKKFLGAVGHTVTKVLLLPVYLIMTLINLFSKKKYADKFMYCSWETNDKVQPVFRKSELVERKKKKYVFLTVISDIFSSLSQKRMFLLFPIAIILVILGILLFFASSNAVFSFVYTLF